MYLFADNTESEKNMKRNDSQSSHSTLSSDSASPQLRHHKLKNRKSELIKRQSMFPPTEVRANVAGMEEPDCTLIGYRKLNSNSLSVTSVPIVELGTLQSEESEAQDRFDRGHTTLSNAVSVPVLHGKSLLSIPVSGSMPDLSDKTSSSFPRKLSAASVNGTGSEPTLSTKSSDPAARVTYLDFKNMAPNAVSRCSTERASNYTASGYLAEGSKTGDLMTSILLEVSKNSETSSNGSQSTSNVAIENGYLSSRSSDFDKSPLGDSDDGTAALDVSAVHEQVLLNKHRVAQPYRDESPIELDENCDLRSGETPTAWCEVNDVPNNQENQRLAHGSSIDVSDTSNTADTLQNIGSSTMVGLVNSRDADDQTVEVKYTINELLKEELQRNSVPSRDVTYAGDATVTEPSTLPTLPASKRIGMARQSYGRQLHSASQTSLARRRPHSVMVTSSSNPELSSSLEAFRVPEKLVSPVDESMVA